MRNQKKVAPVRLAVEGGPSKHMDLEAFRDLGVNAQTLSSTSVETPKRPPKPQIELNLIDPPQNYRLAKLFTVLLGSSYLAGSVRRKPGGQVAKPRTVITPKAAQFEVGKLVLGQLLSFLFFTWTIVGLYFELIADERVLSMLGETTAYVENAEFNFDLVSEEEYNNNFSGLFATGWVNASYSGPLIYKNFTCMTPIKCNSEASKALPICQDVVDEEQFLFHSSEWLAKGGVSFGNQSESNENVTMHVFPWYPMYKVIHEGYNWANVRRGANGSHEKDIIYTQNWEPEFDASGNPLNPEDQYFECAADLKTGSNGLLDNFDIFLGNQTLNDFLGIPEGEYDAPPVVPDIYSYRYYFGAENECSKHNNDPSECLNHTNHPPYICGFSSNCYAVELPDEEYQLYANTYCNDLKVISCSVDSTIFLCELRDDAYTPPDTYRANSSIGTYIDLTEVNATEYLLLRQGNYSIEWSTPFSTLEYWEFGNWTLNDPRRTGDDLLVTINASNGTFKWISNPAGSFKDCIATPSTSIEMTWCETNDGSWMIGLDRGEAEYLYDIVDAFEASVVFTDTDTIGFSTDCYEADWFLSMNDEGWSGCDQNYYLTGILIGEKNTYLYYLEGGRCCRVGVTAEYRVQLSVDLDCTIQDWDGVINGTCPEGSFLQSLYRVAGSLDDADRIYRITQARCCTTAIPTTCSDGRMNGIEEGVDCGGDCEYNCGATCYGDFTTGVEVSTEAINYGRRALKSNVLTMQESSTFEHLETESSNEMQQRFASSEEVFRRSLNSNMTDISSSVTGSATTAEQENSPVSAPMLAFFEWQSGSLSSCDASTCEDLYYDSGGTTANAEMGCCLQACLERGFFLIEKSDFEFVYDITPAIQQPSEHCKCDQSLASTATFRTSSIMGSFNGEMNPAYPQSTDFTLYRDEGGASLALSFDLQSAKCLATFLVVSGEVLGVDDSAYLESALFLASQYNMWFINFEANAILWTDLYDEVHMTLDQWIYNVEDCMLPAAVFNAEAATLQDLTSFCWILWVGLVIVGVTYFIFFCFITAVHRVLLLPDYRTCKILWGTWQVLVWLLLIVQACKSLIYVDLLAKGTGFDLWSCDMINIDGEISFWWLLRGLDVRSHVLSDTFQNLSQGDIFKLNIWAQLFLIGFNVFRTVSLDISRRLTAPLANWTYELAAIIIGFVGGALLVAPVVLQVMTYAIGIRFHLSYSGKMPENLFDVAPEVCLAGVAVIFSALILMNTIRLGISGYFPLFPHAQCKDKSQGFRNCRSSMFGVLGGCDQNFSDSTGKFMFTRLFLPIGLGPIAVLVGALIFTSPYILKEYIVSVVSMESFYCVFDGVLLDIAIGVNATILAVTCVLQFMCFSACRN